MEEEKWKKENRKLRSLLKFYSEVIDEHKVRLRQLMTEKMAAKEDQPKLADLEKKIEEAKLYAQATDEHNKQLQELSISHDKDKNEWKKKVASYEEKYGELKKSFSESKAKLEMEKKQVSKELEILLELSEVLLKEGLFPKKYKRLHRLWKSEVEKNKDGTDEILFDLEENLKEKSAEVSSSNSKKKSELVEITCLKEGTSQERDSGALLALMSESESEEET